MSLNIQKIVQLLQILLQIVRPLSSWLHKTVLSVSFEQERETCTKKCFVPQDSHSNSIPMFDFKKFEVYTKAKKHNETMGGKDPKGYTLNIPLPTEIYHYSITP